MKRLLSIVTLLVTLALTGQSQQVLWSRHFVMQPNPDTNFRNFKSATFTNLVKNGNTLWASVDDYNRYKEVPGSGQYMASSTMMILNSLGDSLKYIDLNVDGFEFSVISKDCLDSNSAWAAPVKGNNLSDPQPFSLNLIKIHKSGLVTNHIQFSRPFFIFKPRSIITTYDSSVIVVGSLNVDSRNTERYDMFVAKFHVNGQLKWLNTYNTHVADVRTYSVNLVGQDSLVVTAFWGRSVFNTYIDKDGYVYDNKVIWNDPGRRLVDKMRLLPTPDGGYFLIGEVYYSYPITRTYWHKMDHNFNVQWSDSSRYGNQPDMMIANDGTFTQFLPNIYFPPNSSLGIDTVYYIKRRILDNSVVSMSKFNRFNSGGTVISSFRASVLTGNNSAIAVGSTTVGSSYRLYPFIFRIFGVGEPYNPGPLSTPGLAQKAGQPYLYPNPLVSGWQVAGISPDAGSAVTLTWYDAQGRMLGSQQVVPGVAQTEVPKARGVLFYRVTWQEQGLKMASGKVVVE